MKPKIAYLVDKGSYWGDPADWRFYTESEYDPDALQSHKVKRIVYWEVEDDQGNI